MKKAVLVLFMLLAQNLLAGDVIQYDPADPTVPNRVTLHLTSVPTGSWKPVPANTLVNYQSVVQFTITAGAQAVAQQYWKHDGAGNIVAMSAAEQTAVDAEQATADFRQAEVQMVLFDFTTAVATGDGAFYFHIATGSKLIGMDLVDAVASVITVSSSGLPQIDIARCAPVATGNPCSGTVADVLTVNLTIDANEDSSDTATTDITIATASDDVIADQTWRLDVDAIGTGTQGLIVTLIFQLP